jgi:hypothetical protein
MGYRVAVRGPATFERSGYLDDTICGAGSTEAVFDPPRGADVRHKCRAPGDLDHRLGLGVVPSRRQAVATITSNLVLSSC